MVNNIPSYYDVKIFLDANILGDYSPKWPLHISHYDKYKFQWPLELYEMIDTYFHSFCGDITVLIDKKTYQPYSFAKSALK